MDRQTATVTCWQAGRLAFVCLLLAALSALLHCFRQRLANSCAAALFTRPSKCVLCVCACTCALCCSLVRPHLPQPTHGWWWRGHHQCAELSRFGHRWLQCDWGPGHICPDVLSKLHRQLAHHRHSELGRAAQQHPWRRGRHPIKQRSHGYDQGCEYSG
jgi:hypothetical protein